MYLRLIVIIFLFFTGTAAYAQQKNGKVKPVKDSTNQKAPVHRGTGKEDAPLPPPPPPMDRNFVPVILSKPVPAFDTTAAPDDAHTDAIQKLLIVSNSKNLGAQLAGASLQSDHPAFAEYRERFLKEISGGEGKRYLDNYIIKLYREYFTLEEIKALNAFYESEAGRKYIRVLPTFLADVQLRLTPITKYFDDKVLYDIQQAQKKQQ